MDYFLLIFETLLGFICSTFLLIWGIREFKFKKDLAIPSVIFGALTMFMTTIAFHHISVEQGKSEIKKEIIESQKIEKEEKELCCYHP